MSEKDFTFAGCIGYIVIFAVVFLASMVLGAFVVQSMWGWFIVPLGAQPIELAHAAGLSMFVSYFTFNLKREGSSPYEDGQIGKGLAVALLKGVFQAVLFLVIGGVIAGFMVTR